AIAHALRSRIFGVENAQRISLQRFQFVQAVPYGSHDTALGEFSAELRIDVASKIAEHKVAFVQLLSRADNNRSRFDKLNTIAWYYNWQSLSQDFTFNNNVIPKKAI
ncbi:hypothetical protein ACLKA7_000107, partial [Drosophila subpalustris]